MSEEVIYIELASLAFEKFLWQVQAHMQVYILLHFKCKGCLSYQYNKGCLKVLPVPTSTPFVLLDEVSTCVFVKL